MLKTICVMLKTMPILNLLGGLSPRPMEPHLKDRNKHIIANKTFKRREWCCDRVIEYEYTYHARKGWRRNRVS